MISVENTRVGVLNGFFRLQEVVTVEADGIVPEQLDSFVLICYDFGGVIMELFVLCKDARQWSGLLQRSSIGSGL